MLRMQRARMQRGATASNAATNDTAATRGVHCYRAAGQSLDNGLPLGPLRCVHLHDDVILFRLPRLHVLMGPAWHGDPDDTDALF